MGLASKLKRLYNHVRGHHRAPRGSGDTFNVQLPPELWLIIIFHACEEYCYATLTLSLVCRTFHDLVTRAGLEPMTLEAHGVTRLTSLLSRLSSNEDLGPNRTCHMLLSSRELSGFAAVPRGENGDQVCSSTRLIAAILSAIDTSHLRTLTVFLPRLYNYQCFIDFNSLLANAYPVLEHLAVHGPIDRTFFLHCATMPELQTFHIASHIGLPGRIDVIIRRVAPNLRNLRVSGIKFLHDVEDFPQVLQTWVRNPLRRPRPDILEDECAFPPTLSNISLTFYPLYRTYGDPDLESRVAQVHNEMKLKFENIAKYQWIPGDRRGHPKLVVDSHSAVSSWDALPRDDERRYQEIRNGWLRGDVA